VPSSRVAVFRGLQNFQTTCLCFGQASESWLIHFLIGIMSSYS